MDLHREERRYDDAMNFMKSHNATLFFLREISPSENLKLGSTEVLLGDAASMCGIAASDFWDNFVSQGKVPLYNGDASATEFLSFTILFDDVIKFFCDQERARRRHERSYQEVIKTIISVPAETNKEQADQTHKTFARYLDMPEDGAKNYESFVSILSRFLELNPPVFSGNSLV